MANVTFNETATNATSGLREWLISRVETVPWLNKAVADATWPPTVDYLHTIVYPVVFALLTLYLIHYISYILGQEKMSSKTRGVPVKVPGPGFAYRHKRFLGLLETPFEGGNTIAALFDIASARHAARPLLGTRELLAREEEPDAKSGRTFEKLTFGEYSWQTYGEVRERVAHFASGLVHLGHRTGERVAIFAETRAEWFIALQAAFQHNFCVVTVYASLGEDALVHSLNETEVTTVIVDSKQLEKILKAREQLSKVQRVIYMEEQKSPTGVPDLPGGGPTVESFASVEKRGAESPLDPELPKPADAAVIMYTSGSTGMPKGVMMSHANLVATIAGVMAIVPDVSSADLYIAYLPLAHVLELVAETGLSALGVAIGYSSPLTLIDSSAKVKKGTRGDAPALQPTLMAAVPAILDRIRDGVRKKVDGQGGAVKALFELAYQRRVAAVNGSILGAWGLEKWLWDAVVFKSVRAAVGGRVRFMLSGGAPLSGDTQRFMNVCFGVPVGQGYGLTETCAGGCFTEWNDTSVGRVGPPIPAVYIKLVDWEEGGYRVTDKPYPRGEICIGGPTVTMGYFKNQQKTDEVYETDERGMRWFLSGDIGQFHEDGTLEIVDRKKDIVKLQAGEYVSLGKVEAALQRCDLVDNLMLHADATQSYAVALVVPNEHALKAWADSKGILYGDYESLCDNKDASAEVVKRLAKVGKEERLEKFELPAKVKLLPQQWTPESGLVTSALKIKRESIRKTFQDDLKSLYA